MGGEEGGEEEKKGKGKGRGKQERTGYPRQGKDREVERERDILIVRSIMGLERNLTLGKFPVIHKDDSS